MHDTYIHSININFTYTTKFTKCFLQSLHIYRQFLQETMAKSSVQYTTFQKSTKK